MSYHYSFHIPIGQNHSFCKNPDQISEYNLKTQVIIFTYQMPNPGLTRTKV